MDEQKKILIEKAKQESIEELYGTLISISTDIENDKIINNKIKSRAVGAVRINGNPSFYNGKNLGEICADIKVYITKKDLKKYSPKKVSLTHYCFNDPSVAMKDIKTQAKYGAYKEIISQYKPAMKVTGKQAEQFIHGFTISNDKFDFDTTSYCFNAVGTILPYELEVSNVISVIKKKATKRYFFIKNKSTGKCIDVDGWSSMHNGQNIQSYDCENPNTKNTDQIWYQTKSGLIKNKSTGKCLDVAGNSSRRNGANIQSNECDDFTGSDQIWKIAKNGLIINKSTGKCIDVNGWSSMSNGANIQSWSCEDISQDKTDQFWNIKYIN